MCQFFIIYDSLLCNLIGEWPQLKELQYPWRQRPLSMSIYNETTCTLDPFFSVIIIHYMTITGFFLSFFATCHCHTFANYYLLLEHTLNYISSFFFVFQQWKNTIKSFLYTTFTHDRCTNSFLSCLFSCVSISHPNRSAKIVLNYYYY